MNILFTVFLSFLILLGTHILIWRTKRPLQDAAALFIIFVFIPTLVASLYSLFSFMGILPEAWFSIKELFSIWLLLVAVGCAYIQFYPAAQAVSPSLEMMLLIQKNSPTSTGVEQIQTLFDHKKLVMNRVQDLLNSGMALKKKDKFMITSSGKRLIRFFLFYRRLLGLGYHGG